MTSAAESPDQILNEVMKLRQRLESSPGAVRAVKDAHGVSYTVTDASGRHQQTIRIEEGTFAGKEARLDAAAALSFLAEASRVLAGSLDYESTLQTVGQLAVSYMCDWCAIDVLDLDHSLRHVVVHHSDPAKVTLAHELRRKYPLDPDAPHGVSQVLRTGQPELYAEITDELLAASAKDAEHLRILMELGLKSAMVVPLVARERTLGAITLVSAESGRRFDQTDLALAMELAGRAALAVDNAQLYHQAQRELAERRRAEEAYRESQAHLQLAMDAGGMGAWEWRIREGQVTWSPVLERIHGFAPGTFPGTFEDYQRDIHPEDRERVLAEISRAIRQRSEYHIEYRIIKPDQSLAWLEARGRIVTGPDGEPERMTGICMDVSDRKRVEESLRESEGRLRAVVETAVDGIITIDEHGTITTFNTAAERIFGYRADEVIGRNVKMLMPESYRNEHDQYVGNYLTTGRARIIGIGREVEGLRKDGTRFPLYLGVSETRIGSRRIFTGIVRDISDQKAAEEALSRQARELERKAMELARSNTELENFASIVSHDLRSPLTTIAGSAQILKDQATEKLLPEDQELVRIILDSVEHMSTMITSLLDYARVGANELKVGPCDCEQVIRKVLQGLKGLLEEHDAAVEYGALPTIQADEPLMAQLFQNLIENGIKYHGDAPPRVEIRAQHETGRWVFLVRDNGIGIPPEQFSTIFEAFRRLHEDENTYAGAGIGLATCKKIVERHNGQIWVESQRGSGATFYFAIPDPG